MNIIEFYEYYIIGTTSGNVVSDQSNVVSITVSNPSS